MQFAKLQEPWRCKHVSHEHVFWGQSRNVHRLDFKQGVCSVQLDTFLSKRVLVPFFSKGFNQTPRILGPLPAQPEWRTCKIHALGSYFFAKGDKSNQAPKLLDFSKGHGLIEIWFGRQLLCEANTMTNITPSFLFQFQFLFLIASCYY